MMDGNYQGMDCRLPRAGFHVTGLIWGPQITGPRGLFGSRGPVSHPLGRATSVQCRSVENEGVREGFGRASTPESQALRNTGPNTLDREHSTNIKSTLLRGGGIVVSEFQPPILGAGSAENNADIPRISGVAILRHHNLREFRPGPTNSHDVGLAHAEINLLGSHCIRGRKVRCLIAKQMWATRYAVHRCDVSGIYRSPAASRPRTCAGRAAKYRV